ncbi:hypothetical protein K493DRAFT_404021 [Basidiobolus meristosporus CBS 931.73]|uniref:Sld7 C-terminal domain-containing protein n=1 Tax=Basidiobolus meristosporus CBS 931.73 TaxID=1314790 RepID=A0A1Y1Z874_9FUNG|nr:hypothetical protein K493DRAFT_404021 [Basidiobolus meristosporus CBS 931.73]|eukprot:ORY06468.1 hypothetical protein K493DRAFT_404021 [Basidiobolus meristosporus CBS 931.73]
MIPSLSSEDFTVSSPGKPILPEEDYIKRIGHDKPNTAVKLPAIMKMNNLRRHRSLGPPRKQRDQQKPRIEPPVFYEVDNKKELKRIAVNALQKIGILRGHPDFTAYWSQLYKSCQFALRKDIKTRHITNEEMQNTVEEHVEFYRRQM